MARFGLFLLLLFASYGSFAIDASVAHALFYKSNPSAKDGHTPTLEIYWQVNPASLHFVTTADKNIVARIKTDIVFTDANGVVKDDHFILQTPPKTDPADLATLNILELRKYELPTGMVKILFRLTDMNDTASKFVSYDSVDISVSMDRPFYSDIQLLDTAFASQVKTPFAKDGWQQLPLCADFLDDNKRVLHYYTELNNLKPIAQERYPLIQRVQISKKENEMYLPGFVVTDTIKAGSTYNSKGNMPIGKLTSGNYYLAVNVMDKNGIILARNNHFFQRMNRHPEKDEVVRKEAREIFRDTGMEKITVLDLNKTFLAKYPLNNIRAILKMLLPVSDAMQASTINNFLKKPDEMYMRYYIYNHFLDINKDDPGKAWKEYSEKVLEVNKKFTGQGTAGYETDRGYIYLRYGPPSDIITVANETGALPYEIWQYNTLTQFSNKKELPNAYFLFYKPGQMMSDYRLLHSTVPGEVINMSWRMYLYAGGNVSTGAGINPSSRAEQYIGNR